jgi:hypothetical protein
LDGSAAIGRGGVTRALIGVLGGLSGVLTGVYRDGLVGIGFGRCLVGVWGVWCLPRGGGRFCGAGEWCCGAVCFGSPR